MRLRYLRRGRGSFSGKVVVRISWGKLLLWGLVLAVGIVAVLLVRDELQSSRWQARYLAQLGQALHYKVEPGPSPGDTLRFPQSGPFDERLGYSRIPGFTQRLNASGYALTDQARMSPRMVELIDEGLNAPYREKTQAGLRIEDCRAKPLFVARFPERAYASFESVPALLVESLLFIENRELLDSEHLTRNPAVEWKRFSRAVVDQLRRAVDEDHDAPGGSTLATQIEKYRHSPEGRTSSGREKLRQMASASVRAYLDGEDTLAVRRQVIVDYLNTVPLTARAGYGEINGIGDGMWAWYGEDFAEANKILANSARPGTRDALRRKAELYKEALSLMIAQRRPAYYLHEGADDLQTLTDSHLRVLASEGAISAELRDAALPIKLRLRRGPVTETPVSFVTRKATTAMRTHLSSLLGIGRLYDLDRLDLTVGTGLNSTVQQTAAQTLRGLGEPAAAKAAGLYGFRMLKEGDDPSRIVYSFTLFEKVGDRNVLRVQTDNFDQPFDINEGAKLDLGSTAKFRTLVTYLEMIAALHQRYAAADRATLDALEIDRRDALTRWAVDYLKGAEDKSLQAMLEAAMERQYSGNPGESFYTGGGVHTFVNFEHEEDHRMFTVREGFRHSVNLVFIRMMRDIVRHVIYGAGDNKAKVLEDHNDPRRREYLAKFADREGREFVARFFRKYRGKSPAEAMELLLQSVHRSPRRLAAAYRTVEPDAGFGAFREFMQKQLQNRALSDDDLSEWYEKFAPEAMSLADRGYVAGVHPLELWLVGFVRRHPEATLAQVQEAGGNERQEVYTWLFNTRHKQAQDLRIQSLLEIEAFLEIARSWRRLGYPFESLTPSYASSIGASGDRPAALAELMGIIANHGMRMPVERLRSLAFAAGTPYETRLAFRSGEGERVLPAEIADIAWRSLLDVVEGGTAKRLQGAFRLASGEVVPVGGKTGTGDHRFDVFGRGGRLISSRVVNRSATFMFILGDRYFGTITAYVHEPYAAKYTFTSALSAQLLKSLAPTLLPLLENNPPQGGTLACPR